MINGAAPFPISPWISSAMPRLMPQIVIKVVLAATIVWRP
jgi:hypothetical protein